MCWRYSSETDYLHDFDYKIRFIILNIRVNYYSYFDYCIEHWSELSILVVVLNTGVKGTVL